MRKISHKLFQDLKLENAEIIKVIGGSGTYTTVSTDTNVSNGSYDIGFESCIDGLSDISIVNTGTSDKDKPVTTKLNNSIQG